MNTHSENRRDIKLSTILLLCSLIAATFAFLAISADLVNPRADFWRLVRNGVAGYTAVSSEGHSVLIHNGGEVWREFRNVIIIDYSPWLMGGVLVAIGIFHLITGGDKLEEPRSGIKIKRFSLYERLLHWFTATMFIIMALTGLSILLGRASLIPVTGHSFFAGFLLFCKVLHNWCGPLLLAGFLLELIAWGRNNIFHKYDIKWFKNLGGMVGDSPRPHAGKVNGGEKVWFWLMILFGTAVGISGVLLDFPIWGQDRLTMQISLAVHAVVAVLFITASFGHMYMGSIGLEGAFEGMWKGEVDAVWAKQHADLWYEKKAREDERLPQ